MKIKLKVHKYTKKIRERENNYFVFFSGFLSKETIIAFQNLGQLARSTSLAHCNTIIIHSGIGRTL